jgi:hypothetical protein
VDKRALFRIKAATRDLVDRLGGIERAAELVDYGKSTVGRWCHPDSGDVVPLMCALVMEREAGATLVTEAMAAIHGLKLETLEGAGEAGCITSAHLTVTREVAELMTVTAGAMADGTVTPHEARAIDEQASDLEDALTELRRKLAIKAVPASAP